MKIKKDKESYLKDNIIQIYLFLGYVLKHVMFISFILLTTIVTSSDGSVRTHYPSSCTNLPATAGRFITTGSARPASTTVT